MPQERVPARLDQAHHAVANKKECPELHQPSGREVACHAMLWREGAEVSNESCRASAFSGSSAEELALTSCSAVILLDAGGRGCPTITRFASAARCRRSPARSGQAGDLARQR